MFVHQIGNTEYQFGDTLRVLYNLKSVFKLTTFQEVLTRLQKSEFDDQFDIVYESYKTATNEALRMSKSAFTEMCLDNMGIVSIAKLTEKIVEGLIYTGVSKEERGTTEKNLPELSEQ